MSLNVIIIAHPDDESLFFASLPLTKKEDEKFVVICVTDANADGMGEKRKKDFMSACQHLGIDEFKWLGFPDVYEKRLYSDELKNKIKESLSGYELNGCTFYTHGPLGEYMHPHHQDVSMAVHDLFDGEKIFFPAYNCYPEKVISLTKKQFQRKTDILSRIYGSETIRFANLIPASWYEGFSSANLSEVREIYGYLAGHKPELEGKNLSTFLWLEDFITARGKETQKRLF